MDNLSGAAAQTRADASPTARAAGREAKNPYERQGPRAFWRTAAAQPDPLAIGDLYRPKFPIDKTMSVATQGSCFAQHIGLQFVLRGYNWLEAEPPLRTFPAAHNTAYNYGLFSFRTGNLYTPRLLLQWLRWASGEAAAPPMAWPEKDGVLDPFRPAVEPGGFASEQEMLASRERMLRRMAECLPALDLFVFTLGQTEAWEDRETGLVYPMCPGTIGGSFDPDRTRFVNYTFTECSEDMRAAIALLRQHNPAMKVILTVSPVPMVATATDEHVLVANGRTKSILRAVGATLSETEADVDYFPSYEMVTAAPFRSMFYGPTMRSILPEGVSYIMGEFFRAHGEDEAPRPVAAGKAQARRFTPATERALMKASAAPDRDDVICEEIMLEAAAPGARRAGSRS